MELVADVSADVMLAVVTWAARHNTSVSLVVSHAVTEYMLDVDAGLLRPPDEEYQSLAGLGHRYNKRRGRRGKEAA
jgi:hypothetical protein